MPLRKICENSIVVLPIQYCNDIKELSKAILGKVSGRHATASKLYPLELPVEKTHGYEIGSRDVSLKDKRNADSRRAMGL
jgi:hypothetical protein